MAHSVPSDSRYQLLLVDDCVAERDLYELVLEHEFRVLTAGRGDAGVAIAAKEHPDVVVLDVMMPGLDGWETCTRLKSDPRTASIPVIMLTATDDPNLVPRAQAVGAAAVLTKPCTAGHLRATIETAIHERRGKAVWGNRH